MRTFIRQLVFSAIVAVAAAQMPAHTAASPQTQGDVVYITGGIGADEREELKQLEKEFNLKLLFAQTDGALVSDVAVLVKTVSGKPVLTEQARGPLFLIKLPVGAYVIEATFEGKTQTRKVKAGKKLIAVDFRWPVSTAAETVTR
jgi:hypothetical protein